MKTLIVSGNSGTKGQGVLLSCCGQLKMVFRFHRNIYKISLGTLSLLDCLLSAWRAVYPDESQVLVTKMLLLPVYDMPNMVLNSIAVSLSKTKSTPGLKKHKIVHVVHLWHKKLELLVF